MVSGITAVNENESWFEDVPENDIFVNSGISHNDVYALESCDRASFVNSLEGTLGFFRIDDEDCCFCNNNCTTSYILFRDPHIFTETGRVVTIVDRGNIYVFTRVARG